MVIDYTVRPDNMNLFFGFTPRGAIHNLHNTLESRIVYVQYTYMYTLYSI